MISIYEKKEVDKFIRRREQRRGSVSQEVRMAVSEILSAVQEKGDEALIEYTFRFDGVDLMKQGLSVANEEIRGAVRSLPDAFLNSMNQAIHHIRAYHEKGRRKSWIDCQEGGIILGQKVTPLKRVGIYVPGGRAAYPSSLVMGAVPAQVAGVSELAVVSPPGPDGRISHSVLAVASLLGITEIYRLGGAQAMGALAFGTESVRCVDKIVGPGNVYVAEAKRQVFGVVDIDMIAGPSEVVVLADETARPDFIAADLLAQAEHDPLASSILITPSSSLARRVQRALQKQGKDLLRKDIFQTSLSAWGGILVVESLKQGIELVNALAPEHVGLHVNDPWAILGDVRNAGAIFLGHFSPETVGDYWAGPNHILPTQRTARFSSPLDTEDFLKYSSIIQYGKKALRRDAEAIIALAEMEGLDGHANAVRQRTKR